MKRSFFLLAIFTILSLQSTFAQSDSIKYYKDKYNFEIKNNGIIFSNVTEVPNTSKEVLYEIIKEGLYTYYKNPKKVIQMENKETGTIITNFKRVILAEFPNIFTVPYVLKIKVEDNKWELKIKTLNYENKSDFCGTIFQNHPFEEINADNKNFRVPDICFDKLCEGITNEIKAITTKISENDF